MSQPPTPALAKIKTCQRGQSGPRVQSGRVSSLAHVPKKKLQGFPFLLGLLHLFPFESFPCGLAHVSNTWQQYNQTKSTFALCTHLRYSAFFRYFGNLRVPSRVNTMSCILYCTVQYVCSTKKRNLPETRQSLPRFVSFRFSFT